MLLRLTAVAIVATVATLGATQTKPALRSTQDITCASDLGAGIESKRRFCDVVVGKTAAESVLLRIPPHSGPATLR